MKKHLHDEQFDGALHAVCGRFPHDPKPGERYYGAIVSEDVFTELPRKTGCAYCTRYWWPRGFGDPE